MMFRHPAHLLSQFCQFPISPSRTRQRVEQLESKQTQPSYPSGCLTLYSQRVRGIVSALRSRDCGLQCVINKNNKRAINGPFKRPAEILQYHIRGALHKIGRFETYLQQVRIWKNRTFWRNGNVLFSQICTYCRYVLKRPILCNAPQEVINEDHLHIKTIIFVPA